MSSQQKPSAAKVGNYFLHKNNFGTSCVWELQRYINENGNGYLIAAFHGGVSVGEVERIIAKINTPEAR